MVTSIFLTVSPSKPNDTALILNDGKEIELYNRDLLESRGKGTVHIKGLSIRVHPSNRNAASTRKKLDILSLCSLALPSATLAGCVLSYFVADASGWDAIFPSFETAGIVWKASVWGSLIIIVAHEQHNFWSNDFNNDSVQLEIQIEDYSHRSKECRSNSIETVAVQNDNVVDEGSAALEEEVVMVEDSSLSSSTKQGDNNIPKDISRNLEQEVDSGNTVPFRFIRATKGDLNAARIRYKDTLKWREELGMDTILNEAHPKFDLIKENYPHYFHLRGRKNECCYYEKPPQMKLKPMKDAGMTIEDLLRHYVMCCEFMWTNIEPSEEGKSIYVIDLAGIGLRDFAGEVVDFTKRASAVTAAHYPERSGSIFVINVPSWFSIIWSAVRPMVDDVTKKKISILRSGKEAITKALTEKIPIENIPPEYGGTSVPLGCSVEEELIKSHFARLNERAESK